MADKWACNCDGRQAVFARRVNYRYYHLTFVDQGNYFNGGNWNFPDRPLQGVYYPNHVYQYVKSWEDFEPALSLAEQMAFEDICIAADGIPKQWYQEDIGALVRVLQILHKRRSCIRDLITDFRKSSRNPFPNWREKPTISVPAMPADSSECRP